VRSAGRVRDSAADKEGCYKVGVAILLKIMAGHRRLAGADNCTCALPYGG